MIQSFLLRIDIACSGQGLRWNNYLIDPAKNKQYSFPKIHDGRHEMLEGGYGVEGGGKGESMGMREKMDGVTK